MRGRCLYGRARRFQPLRPWTASRPRSRRGTSDVLRATSVSSYHGNVVSRQRRGRRRLGKGRSRKHGRARWRTTSVALDPPGAAGRRKVEHDACYSLYSRAATPSCQRRRKRSSVGGLDEGKPGPGVGFTANDKPAQAESGAEQKGRECSQGAAKDPPLTFINLFLNFVLFLLQKSIFCFKTTAHYRQYVTIIHI